MKCYKTVALTLLSGILQAQTIDFEAKSLLYFQDSDWNAIPKKQGLDIMGMHQFPLDVKASQNPSEQSISTSFISNHRMVAIRNDKRWAYILETKGPYTQIDNEEYEFTPGNFVSVVQLGQTIKPEYRFPVSPNPTALALDGSQRYLAVSSSAEGEELQIFELDDLGKPLRSLPKVAHFTSGEINDIIWHPTKEFLIYVRKEAKEIGLIRFVRDRGQIIRIEQFGDVIKFEGAPIAACFSKDGKNLFVLDQGLPNEKGGVFHIRLSTDDDTKHIFMSKAPVDFKPTGLSLHPNGEYILVTNTNFAEANTPSTLSVLQFKSDKLENRLEIPLEGKRPTTVRFDRTGKNFAIGFTQAKGYGKPVSLIHFYKFSGTQNPKVDKQEAVIYTGNGLHNLEVIN